MKVERIEAKFYHCGRMARSLRAGHKNALASHDAHKELRNTFQHSIMREAWLFDGRLVAMAGITGSIADAEGDVWLALSDEGEKHPIIVCRRALDYLKRASVLRHRLTTGLLAKDHDSLRLAVFLGFSNFKRETIKGTEVLHVTFEQKRAA